MSYKFSVGDKAVLNTKATDLNKLNGTLVEIIDTLSESNNNDYRIEFKNDLNELEIVKVQEKELQEIEDDKILQLEYGQEVTYTPTGETVKVEQINLLYGQVGIRFKDGGFVVVGLEALKLKDQESDIMEEKLTLSEEILNIILKQYENDYRTYTVPKRLIHNLIYLANKEVGVL